MLIFFPSNLKCDYAVCTAARPLVNSNSYQNYNFSILHKHFKQKYESDSKLVIFRWLKYDKYKFDSPPPSSSSPIVLVFPYKSMDESHSSQYLREVKTKDGFQIRRKYVEFEPRSDYKYSRRLQWLQVSNILIYIHIIVHPFIYSYNSTSIHIFVHQFI